MASSAFPLRFKNQSTKDMLRLVSDQLGIPMNDIAEEAVRQELVLLGAGIEAQLMQIVERLRQYDPERDMASSVAAVIEGESLPDPLQARQLSAETTLLTQRVRTATTVQRDQRLVGALAAFGQKK